MGGFLLLIIFNTVSAQDAALKAAVDACLAEDATGACECVSGCGSAKYTGPIGGWNVAGVKNMSLM